MSSLRTKQLRRELAPYAARSYAPGLAVLFRDLALFVGFTWFALFFESYWLKTLFAILAGTAIGSIFVIGHDAAHNALTPSKRLNALIGRIALLPNLHNYTLWLIVHNRMHHVVPCVAGLNSWTPLSFEEYSRLPKWRQAIERLYRVPFLGFAPYYARERWLKEKFFPPRHLAGTRRKGQYLDFALLALYLATLFSLFYYASLRIPHLQFWEAVVWGFVIPQWVWNTLGGFTVYTHHTHPRVTWYRSEAAMQAAGAGQEDVTVHMVFPAWYGVISNHIMDHPAHHVATKIPLYNLHRAQARLNELLGERAIVERFSPLRYLANMRRCQLYDYENRRWLSFSGQPTSETVPMPSRPEAAPATA